MPDQNNIEPDILPLCSQINMEFIRFLIGLLRRHGCDERVLYYIGKWRVLTPRYKLMAKISALADRIEKGEED